MTSLFCEETKCGSCLPLPGGVSLPEKPFSSAPLWKIQVFYVVLSNFIFIKPENHAGEC
jgi:hypothetical protein